jgi:hypothetical protein
MGVFGSTQFRFTKPLLLAFSPSSAELLVECDGNSEWYSDFTTVIVEAIPDVDVSPHQSPVVARFRMLQVHERFSSRRDIPVGRVRGASVTPRYEGSSNRDSIYSGVTSGLPMIQALSKLRRPDLRFHILESASLIASTRAMILRKKRPFLKSPATMVAAD